MTTTSILIGAAVIAVTIVSGIIALRRSRRRSPSLLTKDSSIKHTVPLIGKRQISPDTYSFRFSLPSPDHVLGLPVGQHIVIYATVNGEPVTRKYTPVTSDEDKGYFDLVIKVYKSGVNPRFPDGGKMTQVIDDMAIGDLLTISGPVGRLTYHGKGKVVMKDKKTKTTRHASYQKMGMIAGGSGIAPMLQLIEAVIRDPTDHTQLFLLFANQTEQDILMRERLEELVNQNPDRLRIWYTVDRVADPGKEWGYSIGFVNSDMIAQHLPPAQDETLILICGPPAMIKLACNPNLDKLGYKEQHRFKY